LNEQSLIAMDSVEQKLLGRSRTDRPASPAIPAPLAPAEPCSGRGLALAVLLIGAFLPPLDFYIVNLALPAIQAGLRATGSQLQLIISCYASAYAVSLITGGRLGDLYGRKRLFITGLIGFILASALCGIAPNSSSPDLRPNHPGSCGCGDGAPSARDDSNPLFS
jgi:hypothetical protein